MLMMNEGIVSPEVMKVMLSRKNVKLLALNPETTTYIQIKCKTSVYTLYNANTIMAIMLIIGL